MLLPCQKGCGRFIDVTKEMIEEATTLGVPLIVQHENCEDEPLTHYRVDIVVTRKREDEEEPVVLYRVGTDKFAKSLSDAFDTLSEEVDQGLMKVRGLLSIIEVDEADPNEKEN